MLKYEIRMCEIKAKSVKWMVLHCGHGDQFVSLVLSLFVFLLIIEAP